MVLVTLVVGGVTRLMHAGLSIVEWKPLIGAIPPLNAGDWQALFEKYQHTPEYQKVNRGMGLDEFKLIFWWEYAHRLAGRAIGLVFLLPFIYFLVRQKISMGLALPLAGIFILGGLQGVLGWYMVQSGLVDDPRVSQYRLAAHLGLAFVIFATMFWLALGLLAERGRYFTDSRLRAAQRFGAWLAALIFLMVLSGALVAGIRAGLSYNTFPLMNGNFMPPEIFQLEPWYLNFFNNMATVQFNHRLLAWLLALLVPLFWFRARRAAASARLRQASNFMLLGLIVQIALGISTLLLMVPVPLAALHQVGALFLFATVLWVNHELRVA